MGPLLGRILLTLVFFVAGGSKIFNFPGAVETLRQVGIGGAPLFMGIALAFELIGALLVLFGFHTRLGCVLLMIFLLPTTLIFHPFWAYEGAMRLVQVAMFLKNVSIYGGLVLLTSSGPGRLSVDHWREGRR